MKSKWDKNVWLRFWPSLIVVVVVVVVLSCFVELNCLFLIPKFFQILQSIITLAKLGHNKMTEPKTIENSWL